MTVNDASFQALRVTLPAALLAQRDSEADGFVALLAARADIAITQHDSQVIHETMADISRLRRLAEQTRPDWHGLQQLQQLISNLEMASDALLAHRQAQQPFPWSAHNQ